MGLFMFNCKVNITGIMVTERGAAKSITKRGE